MSQSIIQLTDNAETQSIDIAMGLDQDYDPSSPAHMVARFVCENMPEIVAMMAKPAPKAKPKSNIIIEG